MSRISGFVDRARGPGGSGLSEWLFSEYYGDLVPTAGMALILAIFWRVISYYMYLCIGALIVPGWLGKSIGKAREEKEESKENGVSDAASDIKTPTK